MKNVSFCGAIGNALKQIQIATHLVDKISQFLKYHNINIKKIKQNYFFLALFVKTTLGCHF